MTGRPTISAIRSAEIQRRRNIGGLIAERFRVQRGSNKRRRQHRARFLAD